MSIKTENLAIVLTDIAGYTEATVQKSRLDNARLLATHNRILYPIIKRYKGRHVKSIGDALLLVFRSPTDAMLCAMAMQDALFEFNRNNSKELQIHIRVAASLGEVRVTRNDVFGEAVNITSRIESITPPDDIYMSEAVYMAMNKAEVPSQEVGRRELKGISGPIRIFNIPRFSTPRLVPLDVMAAEDMSDLVYPYGGAHLVRNDAEGGWRARFGTSGPAGRVTKLVLAGLVLLPIGLLAGPGIPPGPSGPIPARPLMRLRTSGGSDASRAAASRETSLPAIARDMIDWKR
jgi:class 3 adenylate cyclase